MLKLRKFTRRFSVAERSGFSHTAGPRQSPGYDTLKIDFSDYVVYQDLGHNFRIADDTSRMPSLVSDDGVS